MSALSWLARALQRRQVTNMSDTSFGFAKDNTSAMVTTRDDFDRLKTMATDFATALHRIASHTNEADTVRAAVNALTEHGIEVTDL